MAQTVGERLDELETTYKALKLFFLIVLLAVLGLGIWLATFLKRDVMRAGKIEITGDNGAVLAVLQKDKAGGATLTTFNASGKPTLSMGTTKAGHGTLSIYNENGKPNIFLQSTKAGGGLIEVTNRENKRVGSLFSNENGNGVIYTSAAQSDAGVHLVAGQDGGAVRALNPSGNPVLNLGVLEGGGVVIARARNGKGMVSLSGEQTSPKMQIYNQKGGLAAIMKAGDEDHGVLSLFGAHDKTAVVAQAPKEGAVIQALDAEGKTAAQIHAGATGGEIAAGGEGKTRARLFSGAAETSVDIISPEGRSLAGLILDPKGNGTISARASKSKSEVFISADPGGSGLKTLNNKGKTAIALGVTENGDGLALCNSGAGTKNVQISGSELGGEVRIYNPEGHTTAALLTTLDGQGKVIPAPLPPPPVYHQPGQDQKAKPSKKEMGPPLPRL